METTGVAPSADGQGRAGPEPTEAAKQMASAAGATVKQEIATFASTAQDKAHAVVDEQRQTAAKAIGDFASAIQHAGDELAQNDQSMAGHLIKQAADRLGELAHTVSDKRPEELLTGLREFGRRNPAAFAAASALAGFAIGRLVRSSVEPIDESTSSAGVTGRMGAGQMGTGLMSDGQMSDGRGQAQLPEPITDFEVGLVRRPDGAPPSQAQPASASGVSLGDGTADAGGTEQGLGQSMSGGTDDRLD